MAPLLAQPGHGVACCEFIDQAKPLGGSYSLAKCAAASLKKSLLPPELAVLLAEPVELSAFLAGEQELGPGAGLTEVNPGLAHPARQAAGRRPKALSEGIAGEALLKAELHGLRLLLRREPTPCSGEIGLRWTA
jgi:hypothetical protein